MMPTCGVEMAPLAIRLLGWPNGPLVTRDGAEFQAPVNFADIVGWGCCCSDGFWEVLESGKAHGEQVPLLVCAPTRRSQTRRDLRSMVTATENSRSRAVSVPSGGHRQMVIG